MCGVTLLAQNFEEILDQEECFMQAISIIIPMYGVEKYLHRCLDSVLNQTFTDWQAICVDDGSPDASGAIAEEYARRDKRFVVIHQENAGRAVARNTGLHHATGEFVMFLDADDFIHPQTMEMTYYMTRRDDTDIVSYTYDTMYRFRLKARRFLGMDIDNVIPFGMNRRYGPENVCSLVTNNIFKYVTEQDNNMFNMNRQWMIKHCEVWKHLYRRSLIKDIHFIKGILFEDFPWWSAVILKNPRATILNLPLYYYCPHFDKHLISNEHLQTINSLCLGIEHTFSLYNDAANQYQFQMWNKKILWSFIDTAFQETRHIHDMADLNMARDKFIKLCKMGVFDFPPNQKMRKLRSEILRFVGA